MKKFFALGALLSVTALLLHVNSHTQSAGEAPGVDFFAEEAWRSQEPSGRVYGYDEAPIGYPVFEFGAVKLSASGPQRCGAVTLVADPQLDVRVHSQHFVPGWGGTRTGKRLSDWEEIPYGGMRVKYDRSGSGAHYKIWCQVKDRNNRWVKADCSRVLSLRDIRHNKFCYWGPGGVDADYSPLNMRKSK